MNAAFDCLAATLAARPEAPAYLFGDHVVSYAALWASARRFASWYAGRGVRPGDRVVLVLPDIPALPAAFLGAIALGAVAVPVGMALPAEDYAYLLNDCRPAALLVAPGHPAAEAARQAGPEPAVCDDFGPEGVDQADPEFIPADLSPDDPAFMLYTSGTTGRPKGVPHRHEDVLLPSATWGADVLRLSPDDLVFSASKMHFAYGLLASLLIPLPAGASVVLHPGKPGGCELWDVLARYRPTAFFGVPTLYNLMIRTFEPGAGPGRLRLCYSAGEALPEYLLDEWKRLTGIEILDGIGSTEACNVFISNRAGEVRPGTSGRPVAGFEVRLVDDAGNPVKPGAPGHLEIRGASLARSYWNQPEKTRQTMLPDGFVRTGDIYVEKDGAYSHQGRSDDMIKSGAHWVSPVRIEDVLLSHPGVAECAVAAKAVDGLARPWAFVVLRPGVPADPQTVVQLRRHVLSRLPAWMCPVRFEFTAEIPKTPTGKIQRFKLRG